jgi:hypothetical protein
MRFTEACQLAECYGFRLTRQRGSHHLFSRPGFLKLVNLQDDNGGAKGYQVRQLLRLIEEVSEVNAADDEEPANA